MTFYEVSKYVTAYQYYRGITIYTVRIVRVRYVSLYWLTVEILWNSAQWKKNKNKKKKKMKYKWNMFKLFRSCWIVQLKFLSEGVYACNFMFSTILQRGTTCDLFTSLDNKTLPHGSSHNLFALRMAKTLKSFSHSECERIKGKIFSYKSWPPLQKNGKGNGRVTSPEYPYTLEMYVYTSFRVPYREGLLLILWTTVLIWL